jgi:hypothetical protein
LNSYNNFINSIIMSDIHLHLEEHMKSTDLLSDIVIGMSDGLTVPFALAAGLSGAVGDHVSLIWIAGIAEIAAIANLAGGLVCEEVGVVPINASRLLQEVCREIKA